jgi:hypothetical protein
MAKIWPSAQPQMFNSSYVKEGLSCELIVHRPNNFTLRLIVTTIRTTLSL